jgi:hypothetical protein
MAPNLTSSMAATPTPPSPSPSWIAATPASRNGTWAPEGVDGAIRSRT